MITENPYDPWKRTDLTKREKIVLKFMDECLHGENMDLIDKYIAEDYIQHTPNCGQGREGIRNYVREIAWKRKNNKDWRAINIWNCGDFVLLHKTFQNIVLVDIIRFNDQDQFQEHWDVVQKLPEYGYDPMKRSDENLDPLRDLFGIV